MQRYSFVCFGTADELPAHLNGKSLCVNLLRIKQDLKLEASNA